MTDLRAAAQRALEAMEAALSDDDQPYLERCENAVEALRAALEQEPVQEPVAWMDIASDGQRLTVRQWSDGNRDEVPLYTAPPQRKPLTDETLWEMWVESPSDVLRFARAIEAAHGITGPEDRSR